MECTSRTTQFGEFCLQLRGQLTALDISTQRCRGDLGAVTAYRSWPNHFRPIPGRSPVRGPCLGILLDRSISLSRNRKIAATDSYGDVGRKPGDLSFDSRHDSHMYRWIPPPALGESLSGLLQARPKKGVLNVLVSDERPRESPRRTGTRSVASGHEPSRPGRALFWSATASKASAAALRALSPCGATRSAAFPWKDAQCPERS